MTKLPIYLLTLLLSLNLSLGSANYDGENGIGVVEENIEIVQQVPEMIPPVSELSYRERLDNQVSRGEIRAVVMETTAYTHTGQPCFTGVMPYVGGIAVDPDVIPLGSEVYVDGYGLAKAVDTGGAIEGNIIDLFMDTENECDTWGRQHRKVYILKVGG